MDIMTDGPTLVLSGDFDVRSTWRSAPRIYDHLDEHDEDVVVDLTDVDAIDVTALKVLAVATRAGQPRRPPPHAARLRPGRAPDAPPLPADPGRRGRARRPSAPDRPDAPCRTSHTPRPVTTR